MRGVMSRIYKVGILHELLGEPRDACRDAMQIQLPGYRHHPGPDVQHSEIPKKQSSPHAGAHLRGDRTPFLGDSGAALDRHPVAGGATPDFKTLGKWQRW